MKSSRINVIRRHLETPQIQSRLIANATNAVDSRSFNVFEYTLDNPKLTLEQRQFYEENGYLIIRNLIDHELLDECRQRFLDIVEDKVEKSGMLLMKDSSLRNTDAKGEHLYNKIQDILDDEVFTKYFKNKELIDLVECFTGPNIKGIHSMLINKPPDSTKDASIHPPHQDLHFFPFRPANRIVAVWTAMEKAHKNNGCLFVYPGTHKGALHTHTYTHTKLNFGYHGIAGLENHPYQLAEMEKGDTIFFHPILIHGSGPNITKGFRKSISCHYAAAESYYIDVNGTTQESIAKEVETKIGFPYQDLWKLRSRLIRGNEVSL